jgi:DNA-binding MarR family transcriptional regulator
MRLMKSTDIEKLGPLLHDATRALHKRFEERAADYGLSSAQWRLMFQVARAGGVTQARIGEKLEIEPISVSRLVDRMEQAGWVTREPDVNDRRVKLVTPTEKTKRIFDDVRGLAHEVFAEALAGLSESETRAVLFALQKIVDNLSEPAENCSAKEEELQS